MTKLQEVPIGRSQLHDRIRESSSWLLWLGVATVVLGFASIAFPSVSTLAAAIFVGWMLLLYGALAFFGSFTIYGIELSFSMLAVAALLFSLLSFATGLFLLFNPVTGAIALTLILGMIFVFQGAFEIFFAFEMRPVSGWVGLLISGIASLALAALITALIAVDWIPRSVITLGTLLGVNFISTGLADIFMSRAFAFPAQTFDPTTVVPTAKDQEALLEPGMICRREPPGAYVGFRADPRLKELLEVRAKGAGRSLSAEAQLRLEMSIKDETSIHDTLALAFGSEFVPLMLGVSRAMVEAGIKSEAFLDSEENTTCARESWLESPFGFDQAARAALRVIEAARPEGDRNPPARLQSEVYELAANIGQNTADRIIDSLDAGGWAKPLPEMMSSTLRKRFNKHAKGAS